MAGPVPATHVFGTAGNDMASIMGDNCPGGGITLGPAMIFGFIAGRHLAGVAAAAASAANRPAA